jgi:aspartyl-tRNA(Asn)/glutamyl-tRNA(Gln) amidotransferase subunit A
VADCVAVDGVLAGAPLAVAPRSPRSLRLALPGTLLLDDLDPAVAAAFERALAALSAAGVQIVPQPLAELAEIASINAPGGLSPVEAHAQHRELFETQRERLDPRVAARIAAGRGVSAAEWLLMLQRRADWIARVQRRLAGFDAIVCPTVPIPAPPLEPLRHDDALFFATNARLLRHTLVANFLDGCAITLPCHAPGELPVGLMLTAPGGHDAALLSAALALEALLRPLTDPAAAADGGAAERAAAAAAVSVSVSTAASA